jgi:hypothetical protein
MVDGGVEAQLVDARMTADDVAGFVGNIRAGKFADFVPDVLARAQWARQNSDVVKEIPVHRAVSHFLARCIGRLMDSCSWGVNSMAAPSKKTRKEALARARAQLDARSYGNDSWQVILQFASGALSLQTAVNAPAVVAMQCF